MSKTLNDLNDIGNKLYNTLSKKNVNMLELLCDATPFRFILRENDRQINFLKVTSLILQWKIYIR